MALTARTPADLPSDELPEKAELRAGRKVRHLPGQDGLQLVGFGCRKRYVWEETRLMQARIEQLERGTESAWYLLAFLRTNVFGGRGFRVRSQVAVLQARLQWMWDVPSSVF